jgi:hypothetical protein
MLFCFCLGLGLGYGYVHMLSVHVIYSYGHYLIQPSIWPLSGQANLAAELKNHIFLSHYRYYLYCITITILNKKTARRKNTKIIAHHRRQQTRRLDVTPIGTRRYFLLEGRYGITVPAGAFDR